MEGSGPPPADANRIQALPKVIVSQQLVGEKIERILWFSSPLVYCIFKHFLPCHQSCQQESAMKLQRAPCTISQAASSLSKGMTALPE